MAVRIVLVFCIHAFAAAILPAALASCAFLMQRMASADRAKRTKAQKAEASKTVEPKVKEEVLEKQLEDVIEKL